MYALLSSLVFAAVVAFLWWRMEPRIDRLLAIGERRVQVQRDAVMLPVPEDEVPMPRDLVEWAMQEEMEWAQRDMLMTMRELYAKHKDWEKVRQAMMQIIAANAGDTRSTFS